ncbi:hypothetical protein T492DRAFT_832564 [Pavlovales sp. CCMP2436]|nr:hypothetical protein T492DRAFT_832564 [Pavlovales sp. CCMP2436]
MESLRTLDFNRKVPRDVTEATSVGGAISVCGAGVAVWLFLAQVGGFLATHHVTTLHLDVADTYGSYAQAAGVPASGPLGERHTHPLLISFNVRAWGGGLRGGEEGGVVQKVSEDTYVTMPHVPCSVLSLDVADHRGLHRYDRKRNVFRLRIDENGKSLGLYSAPFIKEGGLLDARRGAAPADKNGPPQNKAKGHAHGRGVAHRRPVPGITEESELDPDVDLDSEIESGKESGIESGVEDEDSGKEPGIESGKESGGEDEDSGAEEDGFENGEVGPGDGEDAAGSGEEVTRTPTHHTHAHTHTHSHTHARTHARTHTHTHRRTHARTHTHAHTHTYTHTYAHTHTHTACYSPHDVP